MKITRFLNRLRGDKQEGRKATWNPGFLNRLRGDKLVLPELANGDRFLNRLRGDKRQGSSN